MEEREAWEVGEGVRWEGGEVRSVGGGSEGWEVGYLTNTPSHLHPLPLSLFTSFTSHPLYPLTRFRPTVSLTSYPSPPLPPPILPSHASLPHLHLPPSSPPSFPPPSLRCAPHCDVPLTPMCPSLRCDTAAPLMCPSDMTQYV